MNTAGRNRVALYLRTSTADQHTENQLPELERYSEARRWSVVDRYVDHGESGAAASRPELDRLLADARRRRFDIVLVWSISRFGRSMVNAVLAMHELTELGIRLVGLQQGIDSGSAIGRGVVALLAALAEAELEEKRERVRAGVRRARAQGRRWGRPKKHVVPVKLAEEKLAEGASLAAVAADLGVPKSTLHRQLQAARKAAEARPENPGAGDAASG